MKKNSTIPSPGAFLGDREILNEALHRADMYSQATGVGCMVLDCQGLRIGKPNTETQEHTCVQCKLFENHEVEPETEARYPCADIHLYGASQAQRFGGSFIYLCSVGFMHWASPLLSFGRFVGLFVGGPILSIDREDAVDSIIKNSRGIISVQEAQMCVDSIPRCDPPRVQALAQMLSFVAEDVSKNSREDFEDPKRINEQQSRLSSEIHENKKKLNAPRFDESYPLEKERNLLAALRRGDQKTARGILNELLGLIFFSHTGNFEYIKFKSIELLVLLSRAAMENSEEDYTQEETQERYLRALLEADNLEELTDLLNRMVERFSLKIFTFNRVKHASALRKAERYLRNNYSRRLSLSEVARVAKLSPAYFSTLFKQEMGEGFSDYLARLRIEKAALLLLKTNLSLPEIASQSGFEDQSWFSKTFKKIMHLSPGKYREMGGDWASEVEEIHES